MSLILGIGACGANTQDADGGADSPRPTSADAGSIQRALIACYEDHGVDAERLEGGGVLFDRGGTLSKEESFRLADICASQVEALGLAVPDELSEQTLIAQYKELQGLSSCLRDLGYQIPDLVTEELFLADPTSQPHPYEYLDAYGANAVERGMSLCPED